MNETLEKLSKAQLISLLVASKKDHEKQLEINKQLQKELGEKIVYLEHQISLFQKALFGDKKESYKQVNVPEQTKIEFAEKVDLDLPQDVEQGQITYGRKKANKKREDYSKLQLPENLERVVTVIEPQDKEETDVRIGEEQTELLAIILC